MRRLDPRLAEQRSPAADRQTSTSPAPTFGELYDTYFAFVWRSARRLGTPTATLDDVVQEIFIVAHRRLAEFEGRSSLKTWLFAIVLNVVRAHRRMLLAKHPHAISGGAEAPTDTEGIAADASSAPDEIVSRVQAAEILDSLLDCLDDDKRAVFVLAELEQLSVPEIAAMVGVPLNTAYSRLRLARKAFASAAARLRARDTWSER